MTKNTLFYIVEDDRAHYNDKTRIGYEIPFNRHFYVFEPPRPLAEIAADLKRSMDRIKQMIEGLAG